MSKAGRQFERLVAFLEETLAPAGTLVITPGKLLDRTTGDSREVDVVVKFKSLEGKEVVAVGECRDRKRTEDVVWVEQLATKAHDLGADIAFAVSSKGFSKRAKQKAAAHQIQLKSFSDLTAEDIRGWFQVPFVVCLYQESGVIGASLELVAGEDGSTEFHPEVKALLQEKRWEAPIFLRSELPPVSLSQVWSEAQKREGDRLWEGMPPDGTPRVIDYRITLQDPLSCFAVRTETGPSHVACILLKVELRLVKRFVQSTRISTYRDETRTLSQNVEYTVPLGQSSMEISLHKIENTGQIQVGVRMPEGNVGEGTARVVLKGERINPEG